MKIIYIAFFMGCLMSCEKSNFENSMTLGTSNFEIGNNHIHKSTIHYRPEPTDNLTPAFTDFAIFNSNVSTSNEMNISTMYDPTPPCYINPQSEQNNAFPNVHTPVYAIYPDNTASIPLVQDVSLSCDGKIPVGKQGVYKENELELSQSGPSRIEPFRSEDLPKESNGISSRLPLFDLTQLNFVVHSSIFQREIHNIAFPNRNECSSRYIMFRLSRRSNPATLERTSISSSVKTLPFHELNSSHLIFLGRTLTVKSRDHSLITVTVPIRLGDSLQYNIHSQKMPHRIQKLDNDNFTFTMIYVRDRRRPKPENSGYKMTLDFPKEVVYIYFLKTKFMAFHIGQRIVFEFCERISSYKLKFKIREPTPLEVINSTIAGTEDLFKLLQTSFTQFQGGVKRMSRYYRGPTKARINISLNPL